MHLWQIEGYFDASASLKTQTLREFPLTLGRDAKLSCVIQGATISRRHATLEYVGDQLVIQDLESRNGTFVNRSRIQRPTELHHGDIIHLGEVEIRLIDQHHHQEHGQESGDNNDETCFISSEQLSEHFPSGIQDLEHLIECAEVLPVYQPVINAHDMSRRGFELLGRGANAQLPTSPLELFRLAESYSLEVTLSELMRNTGVAVAAGAGLQGELLVNTHPSEMKDIDRLLSGLQALAKRYPKQQLSLEIHEQAITDISVLKQLKKELKKLNMLLAFDDFGVGQSRLLELVEAKPDIIKFDRVLIDQIDTADSSRLNLVKHLLALSGELSITTLAECVSNEAEYRCCETLGFQLYQGFHFSFPQSIEHFYK